jgi:hypothetical protein
VAGGCSSPKTGGSGGDSHENDDIGDYPVIGGGQEARKGRGEMGVSCGCEGRGNRGSGKMGRR